MTTRKRAAGAATDGPAAADRGLRYKRIVAKLGTNLLTAGGDRLDLQVMAALVGQIAAVRAQGGQVIVVSSGAVAAGRHRLGAGRGGHVDVVERQVLASIGMSHLMRSYDNLFQWHETIVAQALLTRRDLADRHGYLNARNTLLTLLEVGAVPVVNENDVVATDEIDVGFGDNDSLSAQVANLVDADLLAILSDIDGLYTADPRIDPAARMLRRVETVDAAVEAMAGESGVRGTGGMTTKLQAAKLATASGSDVVIASGREPEVLTRLAFGEEIGTHFPALTDHVESRRRWMLSGLSVRGELVVDAGAARALTQSGSSLLPAGIREVGGRFERGDSVAVVTAEGLRLAVGIVNYDAGDLAKVRGVKSDQIEAILGYQFGAEAVHRNNLVLL